MQKVILYYKFVEVPDPETAVHWQRQLCEVNGLKGRIIISRHGINGTLGGDVKGLKAYVRAINRHSRFKKIDYKWSRAENNPFPKLSVKVRKELVTLGPEGEFDAFDRGIGLRPKQWHKLLSENPNMPVLDARNSYESDIGKFKGAITPKIRTFKEIKPTLEGLDREQPIATYCTGDIRCEYLSAYMKHLGFKTVYHLDGGIVTYGQEYRNHGLWEGKCYVFDKRMNVEFAADTADIASCLHCGTATSSQVNCVGDNCLEQIVVCPSCQDSETALCQACAAN